LGKDKKWANQLSPRGTLIECGLEENHVWVEGYADTFLRGEITF
jgi:hypothetical protein